MRLKENLDMSKESIDDLEDKISILVKEKENISSENDKLNADSRLFKYKVFELQAKIIDTEIEVAKVKNKQIGPIVKNKR